jgi:hypothetical protein
MDDEDGDRSGDRVDDADAARASVKIRQVSTEGAHRVVELSMRGQRLRLFDEIGAIRRGMRLASPRMETAASGSVMGAKTRSRPERGLRPGRAGRLPIAKRKKERAPSALSYHIGLFHPISSFHPHLCLFH